MKWLLLLLVCGAYDCHYESDGEHYPNKIACRQAAHMHTFHKRYPSIRCVQALVIE